MGNIPIMMMPLAEALGRGIVEEEKEMRPFRLSLAHDIKLDPLKYIKIHRELKRKEDEWLEAIIGGKILRIWGPPLKKYWKQKFDVNGFRNILSKHEVAPVVIGNKLQLFRWKDLARSFGWNKVIDYMWDHHEINVYFEGGFPREKIEPIETRTDNRKMSRVSKDSQPTLFDLLLSGDQMEDK